MPAHLFPPEHREECGLECPRYFVPLRLTAENAELEFTFIFDSGADISLFPLDRANHFRLQYERDLPEARPVTLGGRLDGHTGQFSARLYVPAAGLDVTFPLPCFFYQAPAPAQAATGGPGQRRAVPPARNIEDWEARMLGRGVPSANRRGPPNILGRLGFLSRFRTFLHHERFVVATDDDSLCDEVSPPAKPRRRR